MDHHLVCPHCGQTVAVSASMAGQAAQCPYCNGEFSVPGLAAEPQMAAAPRGPAGNPGQRPANPNAGGRYRDPLSRPTTRQVVNRPAASATAAGNSGTKILVGVIVAMAAACLPIFMFLGYRMLARPAAVARAPVNPINDSAGDAIPPASVSNTESTGASASPITRPPVTLQKAGLQPANSPVAPPANAYAPPAASSAQPSAPAAVASPTPSASPLAGSKSLPPSTTFTPPATQPSTSPSTPGTAPGEAPRSQTPGSTREIVQAVEPSVVVVEVPGVGLGSGFVIDSQGTIATNYHVIEGAKMATVTFLTDKATFPVKGFVAVAPGKDLAILKIEPGNRIIKPLPMAMAPPEKGESVLAFGAPKGFGGSVSDGIVSSVRSGTELQELLRQGSATDIYTKYLGYDLDAVWIQTTAPISGGNSGGPLVNLRGEVVGLNTWNRTDGQNLNFAISIEHMRKLVQTEQGSLKPLSQLPAPRKLAGGGPGGSSGDAQKTLDYWLAIGKINRSMYNRVKKLARPAIAPSKRNRSFFSKMAGYYRKLAEILPEYSARLKDLDVKGVDTELVALATADAMVMESIAEDLNNLALNAELGRSVRIFDTDQISKKTYGSRGGSIAQAYDVMRVNFNLKYGLTFPNISGDARPKTEGSASEEQEEEESDGDDDSKKPKAADKPNDPEKASAQSLALAKQMLKNPITREKGVERLEKIIVDYPGTAAAEEAKKLLKQFGPAKKSAFSN